MAILTGVSETNRVWPEFEMAASGRRMVALASLLLLHGLLWYCWPNLRWQSSDSDARRLEIQWLKLAPVPEKIAVLPPAKASMVKKNSAQTEPKTVRKSPPPRPAVASNAPQLAEPQSSNNPTPVAEASPSSAPDSDPLAAARPLAGVDLEQIRGAAKHFNRNYQADTIAQIQDSHRRDQRMETKLGQNVAKAAKKDCLKAYAGAGLLAIIPLAVSTVVDTGCKW